MNTITNNYDHAQCTTVKSERNGGKTERGGERERKGAGSEERVNWLSL